MRPVFLKRLLRAAGSPAFLVTNPVNIRYLTGVEVSAGVLLVMRRGTMLFVDGRYGEAAKALRNGLQVRDIGEFKSILERTSLCGCEEETVTLAAFARWKRDFPRTRFSPRRGVVMAFRRSKGPEEIRHFRRAQRITREIILRVPSQLRGAVTERELAWKLRAWAYDLGADELAFPPIVAFGRHTSCPHHQPTSRALRRGDLVQVDAGARCHGYCADQSRVFFTARMTGEQERVFHAVQEAKDMASKAVRVGVSTHALDRVARRVLQEHGLEERFVHSLGHGIGLEIHEGVTLSTKRPLERLLEHEIITIEPGVYLPGKFGIRLEDEVVVHS
jgi:Xaa-Pro aminopeptidase